VTAARTARHRLLQPLVDLLTRPADHPPTPAPAPDDFGDDLLGVYLPEPPARPTTAPTVHLPEFTLTLPEDGDDPGAWPDAVEQQCALDDAPYFGTGVLGRYCSWACADADGADDDGALDFTFEITLPADYDLRTGPDDPWSPRPAGPAT
jgi:hypothetical protein